MDAFESLGMRGKDCYAKFIPDAYMQSAKSDRLAILQGLMDTDGWCEKFGAMRFCTSSYRLANQIVILVRSIGGSATMHKKVPCYTYLGKRKKGRLSYICNIQYPGREPIFSLKDKQVRSNGRVRNRRLNIVSITEYGMEHCTCISVSHPTGLYLTDDYIVTHNTALVMNIADHIAVALGLPVGVFSLEMTAQAITMRLICSRARVNIRNIMEGYLSNNDVPRLVSAANQIRTSKIHINDSSDMNILGLRTRARRMQQQHGIKVFIIDYLQLLCGERKRNSSREQEVSEVSKGCKALAKELKVPVIVAAQLNREVEREKDRRPKLSDLRESGSIEQDADLVGMLYRPKYDPSDGDEDSSCVPTTLYVAKQRNGPTGDIPLTFLKCYTRFESAAKICDDPVPQSSPQEQTESWPEPVQSDLSYDYQ